MKQEATLLAALSPPYMSRRQTRSIMPGNYKAFIETYQFVGRVLSGQEEPPSQKKKFRKEKQKITPWSDQEEVVCSMTDEEALEIFLEDPGLTWLMNQCKSYLFYSQTKNIIAKPPPKARTSGKMISKTIQAHSQHGLVKNQRMDSVLSTFPLTVSYEPVCFCL